MWIYVSVCEQKLTAIVNLEHGHCFILPLNSTFVAPLREYYQLVRNVEVCVYVIASVCNVISLLISQHLFCEPELKSKFLSSFCQNNFCCTAYCILTQCLPW